MAESLQSGDKNEKEWMNATLPPPVQFGSRQDSTGGSSINQTAGSQSANGKSSDTNKAKDEAAEERVHRQEADRKGGESTRDDAEGVPSKSSSSEVEIIGHIDEKTKAVDSSPVQSFHSKKSSFSRSGKKRTKSRQVQVETSREKKVETLANSEKDYLNGDTMKIDIKEHSPLDDEEIIDHDDDYGSDDTASSTSSLGDETMPSFEEVSCPSETMNRLAEPNFDVWRLGRDSMVDHLEYMYHELGVTQAWRIPRATLRMFLLGVRERYQDNPYHNFKHCFCVTQMAYSMICKLSLRRLLSVDDLGMTLTAAICHDVDHPGLNNGYHAHAHSPLAILYNYKSILEQHHFAVTCRILTNKERNIFQNVPNRDEILNGTRELILATDLALHKDIMEEYRRNIHEFNFKNRAHVLSLLKIIIKCADVSNEVRPENIATPWVERLFSEYYEQSARERRERLPLTAYMDPEKVDVTESQEGFIKGMMLPMYTELANLIVEAQVYYVNPLKEALLRYELQKRQMM